MTPLVLALTLNTPAHHPPRPVFYPPPRPVPVVSPAYPPPVLPGEPYPLPYPPPHHRPLTLQEFARCFVPTPGRHEVCLVHPVSCKPVTVCFNLPHGCGAPKVKLSKREIEFDFGRREVEIEFRRNGTVDVDYR